MTKIIWLSGYRVEKFAEQDDELLEARVEELRAEGYEVTEDSDADFVVHDEEISNG